VELFAKKKPPLLGIDVSSTAVKVLELSQVGNRFRVESYGVAPVPLDAIVENEMKNLEAIGQAISLAVARARSKTKFAALAVPTSSVISKVLTLDESLSDAEIEAQVLLEAGQFIPYPLNEVSLDFTTVGPNREDSSRKDVLVVGTRTDNIDVRAEIAVQSGLEAKIIDVESYAIEHAVTLVADSLPDGGVDKTIAIIDFGATMTTLTVLHNLAVVYSREEVFGGRQLTETIQRRYNLSYEEAGRAKKMGGLPEDYTTEVLDPFRKSLLPLIRRSLEFFFSSSKYQSVDYILLAGGGSHIPGITEMIVENLNIECSIVNPFVGMPIAASVDVSKLKDDSPGLMICCGLALRSFDL
jgi:type IV pilus assembly protein PilM